MTILLDFESRSRADLQKVGGRNYWAHPSTEAICCAWKDTEDPSHRGVWTPAHPEQRPPEGAQYAAHNAQGFDRFGAVRLGWVGPEYYWIDTSELARVQGWPGNLAWLGERYGYPKDADASRFAVGLSTCRRPSRKDGAAEIPSEIWAELSDEDRRLHGVQAALTPAVLARVVPYCERDVEIMARAWPDLEQWHDLEPDVQRVDRAVNDRGVWFDADLARALLECDRRNAEAVCIEAGHALGMTARQVESIVRAPAQFAELTGAPNAQAETIEGLLLDGHSGETAYELARARQAVVSIVAGKLRAGLACQSPDGMLRDLLWYYGGHTGRWSSKKLQLHNMTRPLGAYEKWTSQDIDDLACLVRDGHHCADQDEIDLLLRACIAAPEGQEFAVCDFRGVEACALAFVSGDHKALEVFASERDPYKVMAALIYGCSYAAVDKEQRGIGKIGVLACGYQMGHANLYAQYGDKLDAAGIGAKEVVDKWRALHAPSVQFWADVEAAFILAINGTESWVSCFRFVPSSDGKDVAIFLPSGRPVVYPGARIEWHHAPWDKARKLPKVATICYDGVKDGRSVFATLYGGKITENIIQAYCRDLMAFALVRAEDAGLNPVLHVHDEIVCVVQKRMVKEAYDELHRIMTTVPEWAAGFPAGAAGFTGRRYRK
jgi:DNA polymerase